MASTTAQNYEQVSFLGNASQHIGHHRHIIGDAVATRTLVEQESGALCLLDLAAGNVYTLPALSTVTVGAWFEFMQTVSVTSNASKVQTAAATEFILGEVLTYTTATASPAGFAGNGTSHVAVSMNGTTSGGLIGTRLIFTALSTTQWAVTGQIVGSGTIITPFA